MAERPSFPFYPGDYLTGTMHLSAAERGCYMDCLCYQWEVGGLPADNVKRLAGIMRVSPAEARRIWPALASKFAVGEDGLWRNARIESVRAELDAFQKGASDRGKAGARARWHKQSEGDAQAMPKHSPSIAQAMPNDGSSPSLSVPLSSKNDERGSRATRGARYGDAFNQRVDPNAVALIIPREGQIIAVQAQWWDRSKREHGLVEADVDAFAKWAGPVVAAEGLNDNGKRFAWLDAMLARWLQARKVAAEGRGMDSRAEAWIKETRELRAKVLAERAAEAAS